MGEEKIGNFADSNSSCMNVVNSTDCTKWSKPRIIVNRTIGVYFEGKESTSVNHSNMFIGRIKLPN